MWKLTSGLFGLLFMLAVFAGCSTLGIGSSGSTPFDMCSAVATVHTQQVAVELGATTLIAMSKTTTAAPADVYAKAQSTYALWAQTQGLLATTLVAINDSNGNPTTISMQQYAQLLIQAVAVAAEFAAIYYTAPAAAKPALSATAERKMLGATPVAASACSITDADISSQLTVPTWAALGGN